MTRPDQIVVVKWGSSSVANENGVSRELLNSHAETSANLTLRRKLAIVTSGSIATGYAMRRKSRGKMNDYSAAAMGSARVVTAWQEALALHAVEAGQVLVTNHEIDSVEGATLKKRLLGMMDDGIVPIINGNDVLSDEGPAELRIDTDNDRLASHVARLLGAGSLVFLTDTDGLYDARKKVVSVVDAGNIADARQWAGEPGQLGTGGMRSKVESSWAAAAAGTEAYIARAGVELQVILARASGTYFPAHNIS